MDRRQLDEIIRRLIPRGPPSSYSYPMENRIFARAKSTTKDAPMAEDPAATIAAVLAKVRVPAAMKNAQDAFRDLQREHVQVHEELRKAINELREAGGETAANTGSIVRRIHELDRRLTQLGQQSRVALETIIRERVPFVEAANPHLPGRQRKRRDGRCGRR